MFQSKVSRGWHFKAGASGWKTGWTAFRVGCLGTCIGLGLAIASPHAVGQVVNSIGDQTPGAKPNLSLVGLWVGVSYLDEEKVTAKYNQIQDQAQREAFVQAVESFLSLAVAVNYQANGTLESDAEIMDAQGDTIREATSGQWRVVESKGLKLLIEIYERSPEGQVITTRKLLQFYEDGEHLATPVETSELLADLNPLVIFERVPPEVVAEMQKAALNEMGQQKIDR
ncbi:MAG TPA: hypothetical protein PKD54_13050 [Pirellulaceae bacterium]|nr:hypothetical protein [Pirellulaceae bacterium]